MPIVAVKILVALLMLPLYFGLAYVAARFLADNEWQRGFAWALCFVAPVMDSGREILQAYRGSRTAGGGG